MRIGIDLGGTKIEAIAFEHNDEVLYRRRVTTPQGDYGGTLSAIAEGLDRPTSLEVVHRTAYVVTLGGEVWRVSVD